MLPFCVPTCMFRRANDITVDKDGTPSKIALKIEDRQFRIAVELDPLIFSWLDCPTLWQTSHLKNVKDLWRTNCTHTSHIRALRLPFYNTLTNERQWFETARNIVVKPMYLLFSFISSSILLPTGTSTRVVESLSDIFARVMPASESAYRYI